MKGYLLIFAIALAFSRAQAGTVTTFAGAGVKGFSGDGGPASQAELNNPYAIARGPDGFLYICDVDNARVRRVGADGRIDTYAGSGKKGYDGDGGPANKASLNMPYEMAWDKAGNLFFVELGNHCVRRVDAKTQTISTIAGTGKGGFSGDGGPAKGAQFNQPHSLAIEASGNVYLADTESHSIRYIDVKKGTIEVLVGNGARGDGPDGDALKCQLARPHGVFVDKDGAVFIGDSENNRVRVWRK